MILDSIEKYEEAFSEIKSEVEMFNGGKKVFYEEDYARTDVNTDDDIPLNKPLKFLTLLIIIECVFQEGEKLYPVYLDKCLYEL